MNNITLKELNESLTPERIIELVHSIGGEEYIERPDCIIFRTICHNEDEKDGSMKLYYYKRNKMFYCYTGCGSFDIFELFEKRYQLLGIKYDFFKDIVLKIAEGVKIEHKQNESFVEKYESIYEDYKVSKPKVDIKTINPNILNIFSFLPIPNWLEEGISENVMRQFNILYSIEYNKIIIPHYNINGELIGIRGRALNDEDLEFGKYMPLKIQDKIYSHPLMYNLYGLNLIKDNIKKYKMAIVAEGEKSSMLYASMFGMEKNICVACCGSNFHRYQIELLTKCGAERILIAFDKEGENRKEQENYYLKLYGLCEKYKSICTMGFIYDTFGLLELKDSPFDRGADIARKLINTGVWIK